MSDASSRGVGFVRRLRPLAKAAMSGMGRCCRKTKIASMVDILQNPGRHILKFTRGDTPFEDKSARDRRKQIHEVFNCENSSNHLQDEFLACWNFRLFRQYRPRAVLT